MAQPIHKSKSMNDKAVEYSGGTWIKGNKPKSDGRYFIKKGVNYKDVLFYYVDGDNPEWEGVTHWLREYSDSKEVWTKESGLTESEFGLEKIVDKIKSVTTLEGIKILQSLIPDSKEGAEALITELVELKKFHINPYNLGDMGRVGEIINALEKTLPKQ